MSKDPLPLITDMTEKEFRIYMIQELSHYGEKIRRMERKIRLSSDAVLGLALSLKDLVDKVQLRTVLIKKGEGGAHGS